MKHLLTLTLLCLGLLAQAQIPSYVPTNGLVGWWPFNGNANDESGNGNHGTVNGATLAADRFGNVGKAYSFDGSGRNIAASCNGFSTGERTISLWFYGNDIGQGNSGRGLIGYGGNGNCGTSCLIVVDNAAQGGNNYEISGHCNNQAVLFNYGQIHPNNLWKNWIITVSNSGTSFFIDGQLVKSDPTFINQTYTNGKSLFFGTGIFFDGINSYYDSNVMPFNGLLDDIAIYNRALSASEVQQLYLSACAKPTFTAQPQNKSVVQGQTTTFAVQVDSASSFQWQMDNGFGYVNLVNSSLFSGVGTSSLTVKGSNSIDGYAFRCIATSCKADTSNAATLTVTSSASAAAGTVAGVPGLINYQGSALDSAGKPMKNQTISLKLSVLDSSSSGAAVYVESHTAATNGSGHFAIQIGGGTALLGTFDSVGWANGRNKYLKTELSQNGTWVSLGTSQLVSVPYALHAGSAEKAKSADEATTLRDSSGNAYQIKTVNGQPTLVAAPGSGSASNPGSFACGQAVNYAGESYPTVQIGTQCWFQKNLNVGTMILGANDQTNNSVLEKYCYNNDSANCAIYGGLYQWAEAVQYQNGASNSASLSTLFSSNVRGICPTGWHLPSDAEYCTLTTFLDATVNCSTFGWSGTDVGGKIKSTSGLWTSPNTGATNSSGFSALPGGYRRTNGTFNGIGFSNYFWSSSEYSNTNAIYRNLYYLYSNIYRFDDNKSYGFSVRCLKD
jgi:uncharacterized protein (TIGR02145 family)